MAWPDERHETGDRSGTPLAGYGMIRFGGPSKKPLSNLSSNTNALIPFTSSLRAIPPWRESVPARRSACRNAFVLAEVTARRRGNPTRGRCEGVARGNLKSSLVSLATTLRHFLPTTGRHSSQRQFIYCVCIKSSDTVFGNSCSISHPVLCF